MDDEKPNPYLRYGDSLNDDYPTATVKLVDALDGYIRALEDDLSDYGDQLTPKGRFEITVELGECRLLLAKLRGIEVSALLHGTIKE